MDVIAADSYSASHKQMIRLRSMYAEDAEDFLLFQVSRAEQIITVEHSTARSLGSFVFSCVIMFCL